MFPERLRQLRNEQGMSQEQLGTLLSMSKGTISMYETGKRQPDPKTTQRIADIFHVSVDYLWGRTDVRQHDDEGRPIPESDLDAYLRQHDLWFKGKPLTYAEKLAARQAIELLRTAMKAGEGEEEDKK